MRDMAKVSVISCLKCKQMELQYQRELTNTSGITPMIEKANLFPIETPPSTAKNNAKKRSASPEEEKFKRSKSVTEDAPKIFDDVKWE